MKRAASLDFLETGEKVSVELHDLQSPKTIRAIIDNLPIKMSINRWGDERYSDETPVKADEENAKSVVGLYDVAYWPEGRALCFFYGPTPISKDGGEILPYSPVNIIGRITSRPADLQKFLKSVEGSQAVLRASSRA